MTLEKAFLANIPARTCGLLDVSVTQMEDRTLVVISGELDMATAPFLREQLVGLLEHVQGHMVLDIGLVTFLGSSGIALFVQLDKKLRDLGSHLVIFQPTPMARRVLEITGLDKVLEIQPVRPWGTVRPAPFK